MKSRVSWHRRDADFMKFSLKHSREIFHLSMWHVTLNTGVTCHSDKHQHSNLTEPSHSGYILSITLYKHCTQTYLLQYSAVKTQRLRRVSSNYGEYSSSYNIHIDRRSAVIICYNSDTNTKMCSPDSRLMLIMLHDIYINPL